MYSLSGFTQPASEGAPLPHACASLPCYEVSFCLSSRSTVPLSVPHPSHSHLFFILSLSILGGPGYSAPPMELLRLHCHLAFLFQALTNDTVCHHGRSVNHVSPLLLHFPSFSFSIPFSPFIFTTFFILFIALSALYLHCLLFTACISPFYCHLSCFFTILLPPFTTFCPPFTTLFPFILPSFLPSFLSSFLPSFHPSLPFLPPWVHPLSLLTASLYV